MLISPHRGPQARAPYVVAQYPSSVVLEVCFSFCSGHRGLYYVPAHISDRHSELGLAAPMAIMICRIVPDQIRSSLVTWCDFSEAAQSLFLCCNSEPCVVMKPQRPHAVSPRGNLLRLPSSINLSHLARLESMCSIHPTTTASPRSFLPTLSLFHLPAPRRFGFLQFRYTFRLPCSRLVGHHLAPNFEEQGV